MKSEDTFSMDNTEGMATPDGKQFTWAEIPAREDPNNKAVKFKRMFMGMLEGFKGDRRG